MSEIVSVTGGSSGIEASWRAALRLAQRFDDVGDRLRTWARQALSTAHDADLLESVVVAPATGAVAEAAVLAAAASVVPAAVLAAAASVVPVAVAFEADADGVRVTIAGLRAADEASAAAMDVVDYALVRGAATALLSSPLAALGAVAVARAGGESLLTEHPALVEHAANGGGGLVDALTTPFAPWVTAGTTGAGAGVLAAAYGRERGFSLRRWSGAGPRAAPRSVQGLLANLQEVAALSPGPDSPGNGTIAVQTLTSAAGRRHVVYLPGTDEFESPFDRDDDVREMQTDLELAAGRPDPYTAGIRAALDEAGVRPGEPVLLVGHSQGGMAAVALAAHPGDLRITDVLTAGAPTAQVGGFPAGTHVLSLEQRGDVVPLLDGAAPRDSVEQTTVVFDAHPGAGVLAHHEYPAYLTGAGLADHTAAPSVVDAIGSLREHGYLSGADPGTTRTTQLFQLTRAVPR